MWPNPQFPDKKTDVSKVLLMREEGIHKKKTELHVTCYIQLCNMFW